MDIHLFDGVMSPLNQADDQDLRFDDVDCFNDQIEKTVSDFNLNTQEAYIVRMVGEHLQKTLLLDAAGQNEQDVQSDGQTQQDKLEQLLLFVTGEGGTGKSRVISAIQDLFSKFGKASWLVTSGSTGKAGCLINGGSIHSYV